MVQDSYPVAQILQSLALHALLLLLVVIAPESVLNPGAEEPIRIEIVGPPKKIQPPAPTPDSDLILPPKKDKKSDDDAGEGPGAKDQGRDDEDNLGTRLEKQLTLDNYAQRVKAIIDPIWYRLVTNRIKYLKSQGKRVFSNHVEVTVRVNPFGAIMSRKITKSSGRQDFDTIAIQSFDNAGQLPPPPSNLLEDKVMILYWDFTFNY